MGPSFHVLQNVRIVGPRRLQGVVVEIRRYEDGTYKYGLASLDEEHREDVAGLYFEDSLIAIGSDASIADFALPGPFRIRDIVRVLDSCPDEEYRGVVGEVTDADEDDSGARGRRTGPRPRSVWTDRRQAP